MDKEGVVSTHNGMLLSHKNNKIFAICRDMDAPREYYAKWNKSDRERQIPHGITYTWGVKHNTNEPNYEAETESQT